MALARAGVAGGGAGGPRMRHAARPGLGCDGRGWPYGGGRQGKVSSLPSFGYRLTRLQGSHLNDAVFDGAPFADFNVKLRIVSQEALDCFLHPR